MEIQRKHWIGGSAALTLLMMFIYSPITCEAAIVWSDDFNDGNYDGWTVTGINMTALPPVLVDGNYSVDDGLLRATGEGEGWIWNLASHPSSVATGTWSFDIDSPPTEPGLTHFYVYFMSADTEIVDGIPDGYAIKVEMILYQGFRGFQLEKYVDGSNHLLAQYQTEEDVIGGYHIDVTRTSSGEFNIWINGTHRMAAQDQAISSSGYFRFSTPAGAAIDNVEVFDSIEFTPTTTSTSTSTSTSSTPTQSGIVLPIELIVIGVVVVVIAVIVVVYLKKG